MDNTLACISKQLCYPVWFDDEQLVAQAKQIKHNDDDTAATESTKEDSVDRVDGRTDFDERAVSSTGERELNIDGGDSREPVGDVSRLAQKCDGLLAVVSEESQEDDTELDNDPKLILADQNEEKENVEEQLEEIPEEEAEEQSVEDDVEVELEEQKLQEQTAAAVDEKAVMDVTELESMELEIEAEQLRNACAVAQCTQAIQQEKIESLQNKLKKAKIAHKEEIIVMKSTHNQKVHVLEGTVKKLKEQTSNTLKTNMAVQKELKQLKEDHELCKLEYSNLMEETEMLRVELDDRKIDAEYWRDEHSKAMAENEEKAAEIAKLETEARNTQLTHEGKIRELNFKLQQLESMNRKLKEQTTHAMTVLDGW